MKKENKGAEKPPIRLVTCEECKHMTNISELNVGFCNSARMPRPVYSKKECIFHEKILNNV